MTVKVLLAEDCELLRKAIGNLVGLIPGFSIVAECGNGIEAVRLAMEHRPDVLLTDISMPSMNGLEATELILRDLPRTRVIVLSAHEESSYIEAALRSGASGFVVKRDAAEYLAYALNDVMAGKKFLSPSVFS
jgi:two-component system response regulator DegU